MSGKRPMAWMTNQKGNAEIIATVVGLISIAIISCCCPITVLMF